MTTQREKEIEGVAMNIVHQIGDVLYDALPPDIAHEHFVKARQATNDIAIDFAAKLLTQIDQAAREELLARLDKFIDENDDGLWSGMETAQTIRSLLTSKGTK